MSIIKKIIKIENFLLAKNGVARSKSLVTSSCWRSRKSGLPLPVYVNAKWFRINQLVPIAAVYTILLHNIRKRWATFLWRQGNVFQILVQTVTDSFLPHANDEKFVFIGNATKININIKKKDTRRENNMKWAFILFKLKAEIYTRPLIDWRPASENIFLEKTQSPVQ